MYKSVFEKMQMAQTLTDDVNGQYQLQKNMIREEWYQKQRYEKIKKEIMQELTPKIKFLLETEAIKQLVDEINKLGK